MIEAIIAGGLLFIVGMLVGRAFGALEGRRALMAYMLTVSHVQNLLHTVHEKYGITGEVDDALKAAGIELQRRSVRE